MSWIHERDKQAAGVVQAMLTKPDMEDGDIGPSANQFDPWALFPCLYGSYSGAFDELAIGVLEDIRDSTFNRSDLAAEMFREMLCTANLCTYGTSPRVCFPTEEFRPLLPQLIDRWKVYSTAIWKR